MRLSPELGIALTAHARAAIGAALRGERPPGCPRAGWAREHGASFVTLFAGEELHGCIGTIEPHRALADDVAENAVAAALRDPRNGPLDVGDERRLAVEVSVLSPLTPIPGVGTRELAEAALRPGVDGIVLRWHGRQATFLPQVWRSLESPHEFLEELVRKARLPRDFWAPDVELYRYSTAEWVAPPEVSS